MSFLSFVGAHVPEGRLRKNPAVGGTRVNGRSRERRHMMVPFTDSKLSSKPERSTNLAFKPQETPRMCREHFQIIRNPPSPFSIVMQREIIVHSSSRKKWWQSSL
jgi:hypothetical protein